MNLIDTASRYGMVSRLNHWLGALVVLTLLAIGLYFHDLPKGDERLYWLRLHMGLGGLALLFLSFRVIWRLWVTGPLALEQKPSLQRLARWGHRLLLLLLGVMIVSGPLMVWSGGRPVNIFDWVLIPGPFGAWSALHEALEVVHGLSSRLLLVLILGHVLMAVKHRLVDKDTCMQRMIG